MKRRIIKIIICVFLISCLMVGLCSAYAVAATPVWLLRAKAGIAAALMAANIVFEPYNAALGQALSDVIDPMNMVQTVYDTSWQDYIDQSVITVRPDVVTIDGVDYSEIWLGPDAANNLRASGFDFTTAYNLLPNQDSPVTYADGAGYIFGIPVYNTNPLADYYYSPTYVTSGTSFAIGDTYGTIDRTSYATSSLVRMYYPLTDSTTGETGFYTQKDTSQWYYRMAKNGLAGSIRYVNQSGTQSSNALSRTAGYLDAFSYDYTSGIIDVDPVDDGLLLRVPSSYDGGQGSVYNYDIHDLINVYPQVNDTNGHELIFDPSLNPDFDVDLDMGNALGDIITAIILAKLADLLGDDAEIIYAPFPEKEPVPAPDPDTPDPDVPIGEQDPIWLDDLMRWIKNAIDNLGHTIRDVVDTIHEDLQEIIQSLSELPDKILEEIELGPAKLIDKALDILKTLLMPILLPIRAMMNLWHYVVEWLTSIASPFTWIFGIMAATSYNMVLPIYALLAGGICIAIYKVFGR